MAVVYLVVQSSTRAIYFPQKDTYVCCFLFALELASARIPSASGDATEIPSVLQVSSLQFATSEQLPEAGGPKLNQWNLRAPMPSL